MRVTASGMINLLLKAGLCYNKSLNIFNVRKQNDLVTLLKYINYAENSNEHGKLILILE